MNLGIDGIFEKIKAFVEKNPETVAFGVSAWERQGSVTSIISHYANFNSEASGNYGALGELQNTLMHTDLLKYKLLESPHLYSKIFKWSAIGYILGELGLLSPHYKELAKRIATGSGLAALTLPGSGPGTDARTVTGRRGADLSSPSSITLQNAGAY